MHYIKVNAKNNGTAFRLAIAFIGRRYGNVKRVYGSDKEFKAGCRFVAKKIHHSINAVKYMARLKKGKLCYHKVAYVKAYPVLLKYLMRECHYGNEDVKHDAMELMTKLKNEHEHSVSDGIAYIEKNELKSWARANINHCDFAYATNIFREYDREDREYAEIWRRI